MNVYQGIVASFAEFRKRDAAQEGRLRTGGECLRACFELAPHPQLLSRGIPLCGIADQDRIIGGRRADRCRPVPAHGRWLLGGLAGFVVGDDLDIVYDPSGQSGDRMSPGLAVDDVMAATERAIGVVGLRARLPHHVVAAGPGDFAPGDCDRFDSRFRYHISGERRVLQLELEPRNPVVAELACVAQARDCALR